LRVEEAFNFCKDAFIVNSNLKSSLVLAGFITFTSNNGLVKLLFGYSCFKRPKVFYFFPVVPFMNLNLTMKFRQRNA